MMEPLQNSAYTLLGGSFLIREDAIDMITIPEEFSEEQQMVREMCQTFLRQEVLPHLEAIDRQEEGLMVNLLNKAAEQGLFLVTLPEAFGGMGKDFITGTLITEALGAGHSFSVAYAAHTGIGTLPILYFGNEDQKKRYIFRLGDGSLKGAYALTEPNSGSDALSIKTKAVLNEQKTHYLLNGQKCWITNSGFADLFTVFAKINGTDFTAFIVEKSFPGITLGPEEHKMGIKGSSTRQVFFENCPVPIENVLGEPGKGHKIAFNILNIGRLKLCAAALGGAKSAADQTIRYATQREQFGQCIAQFGAIKHKLAEQAVRIFASESALYRTAHLIDKKEHELLKEGKPYHEALLGAAEEFAVECAILKVLGSEALDYVVDEGVQIHGGNGFIDEYDISRAYRDSRINRIFEGTNEINRLLSVEMILKRAQKGRLNLMDPIKSVQSELSSIPAMKESATSSAEIAKQAILQFKKALLLCAGSAVRKFSEGLSQQQEIVMNLSDVLMQTFAAESTYMRLLKMQRQRTNRLTQAHEDILLVFVHNASYVIQERCEEIASMLVTGDEFQMLQAGIRRLMKRDPIDAISARRRIADTLIAAGKYPF